MVNLDLPEQYRSKVKVGDRVNPEPNTLRSFLERFKLFRPIVQWLHKKADKNRGKIDKAAAEGAEAGDVVLMSPACAAFDQFKNFMVRGDFYKKLVMEL